MLSSRTVEELADGLLLDAAAPAHALLIVSDDDYRF
jgi:hypothetical protein